MPGIWHLACMIYAKSGQVLGRRGVVSFCRSHVDLIGGGGGQA